MLPAASVMGVAIAENNPFNAALFGLFWLLNTWGALRVEKSEPAARGSAWAVALGLLSIAYATAYGHFAAGPRALVQLVGHGPIGVLPCPTLAAIAGLALIFGGASSHGLQLTTAAWALFYGLVGVLWLKVTLDLGLVLAGLALLALGLRTHASKRSRAAQQLHEERQRIDAFLSLKRIALVGASSDAHHFSRVVMDELTRHGVEVVPVHPVAAQIGDKPAFAHVAAITPAVEGALIMTPPSASASVIEECLSAGITKLWLHRGAGQGAVSPEAVAAAERGGAALVWGRCPLMFLGEPPELVHRVHAGFVKLGRHYPARS